MHLRTIVPLVVTAVMLAACSGGGSNSASGLVANTASGGTATGTMTFTPSQTKKKISTGSHRNPAYVSPATTSAGLFIDGVFNTQVGCTQVCSIAWSTSSGLHTFIVEVDNGTTVLSEGSQSYTLTPGNNGPLTTLTLNGVPAKAEFPQTGTAADFTAAVYGIADASNDLIVSPGIFDGYPLGFSFLSSVPAIAIVAATVAAPSGVGNDYNLTVVCNGVTTGTFTIVSSIASGGGLLTAPQLASLPTPVVYPTFTVFADTYLCTSGVLSISSTGTLPVQ